MTNLRKISTGFSLLEVLITVVILATGLLSLTGLQLTSTKNTHNALLETKARYIATTLLNKIRDNPQGLADYLINGATYSCSGAPTPSCISTAVNTTACTATELAVSEKYQAVCGSTVGSITSGGVKNELPNASMNVQCIAADGSFSLNATDCATGDVSISISWGERNLTGGGTSQRTIRITGSI